MSAAFFMYTFVQAEIKSRQKQTVRSVVNLQGVAQLLTLEVKRHNKERLHTRILFVMK